MDIIRDHESIAARGEDVRDALDRRMKGNDVQYYSDDDGNRRDSAEEDEEGHDIMEDEPMNSKKSSSKRKGRKNSGGSGDAGKVSARYLHLHYTSTDLYLYVY